MRIHSKIENVSKFIWQIHSHKLIEVNTFIGEYSQYWKRIRFAVGAKKNFFFHSLSLTLSVCVLSNQSTNHWFGDFTFDIYIGIHRKRARVNIHCEKRSDYCGLKSNDINRIYIARSHFHFEFHLKFLQFNRIFHDLTWCATFNVWHYIESLT